MKKVVFITAISTLLAGLCYFLFDYAKSTNRVRQHLPGGLGYATVVNRHR